jgi:N-acetylglucosaminyldiphosphoundecaprenol N-acetyl-beta-D-mannosaminyltransferase
VSASFTGTRQAAAAYGLDAGAGVRRETVLDVECFAGDRSEAAHLVIDRARKGLGGYACQCNVHVLITSKHEPALARALEDSWLNFPDGAPVAWLQRRVGARGAQRVAGPDLIAEVIDRGRECGLRHFLFGSTQSVLECLRERLAERYPGARIVGSLSPRFAEWSTREEDRYVEEIASARPHMVWCALGAPKQELWMQRNAGAIAPALVIGVGAAFEFMAGNKKRAPLWMQQAGLEWLHRLGNEPGRLLGRYLRTNSEYLLRAAVQVGKTASTKTSH